MNTETKNVESSNQVASVAINCCSARSGLRWWLDSFESLFKRPLLWILIGFNVLCLFIAVTLCVNIISALIMPQPDSYSGLNQSFSQSLTVSGLLVYIVLAPNWIAGIAMVGRAQEKNVYLNLSLFWKGFKSRFFTLASIGLVTAALFLISATIIDPDSLLFSGNGGSNAALYLNYVFLLVYIALTLVVLVLAPLIAVFQCTGFMRAILDSLKAMLVNWRSLLVYELILFTIWFSLTTAMMSIASSDSMLSFLIILPLSFLMFCLLGLSALNVYRGIFPGENAPSIESEARMTGSDSVDNENGVVCKAAEREIGSIKTFAKITTGIAIGLTALGYFSGMKALDVAILSFIGGVVFAIIGLLIWISFLRKNKENPGSGTALFGIILSLLIVVVNVLGPFMLFLSQVEPGNWK